jgi:outer membrane receptor protein involved in Fe transport
MIRRFAVQLTACTCLASGIAQAAVEPTVDPGDIVVTATRRAAPLQRVPISVSAYDQKTMDAKGVRDIADLARFTPGVTYDPTNNQIAIRGVISNAGAGATGIYIDDTPIQMRSIGFASDDTLPAIFDLERVEILRGPQGTLFGAGSEGGTVRYITPQPSLTKLSTYARAELATTAHGGMSYEAGGAVGAPIIDGTLGFRLSAWHRRDGGWVDRVDNDTHVVTKKNANYADTTAIAGALTWAPVDWLSLTPSLRYQKRERNDTSEYWVGISDPKHGKFRNGSPDERHNPDRFILPALKIEAKLGFARLISNTSWYDRREVGSYDGTVYNLSYYQQFFLPPADLPEGDPNPNDPDGHYPLLNADGIDTDLPFYVAPARVLNRQRSFTQEVRLEGGRPGDKLQWTVGLFYQNNRQLSVERIADPHIDTLFGYLFGDTVEGVLGGPLYQGRYSYIGHTASREHHLAVFGQASYEVLPGLTAIAGLRYEALRYRFKNFNDGPQNGGRSTASGGDKARPLTPKVGLSYQINRDNMIYATWSRGYRAGGATPPVPGDVCATDLEEFGVTSTPSSFSPDKVSSFEIGAKSNLFNRRLQIAASAYQLNWHNIQQFVLLPSCGFQYTDNVGNARIRGFEIQASLRPIEGLSIDATAGYTDARFTTTGHPSGGSSAIISRRGDTLGGAPWTATFGAQYDARLGTKTAYIRGDLRYQSANRRRLAVQDPGTVIFDPGASQPSALTEVSLRAGVRWQSLDLSLFVDNLLDATPRLHREHMDSDTLLYTESTLQPRTIGVTLSHRY